MNKGLTMHSVELGTRSVNLAVYDSGFSISGKTVLITAGMDGDEYAGIEAAKRFIKYIKNMSIHGRVIVCPLVNVPGFEIRHSRNPLDGLYPKKIFPGNPDGSPTQRLINWLYQNYINRSDVWIDLHGGATDETLVPFIWLYQTDNPECNKISEKIMDNIINTSIIYEQYPVWEKIHMLASKNITYMIFESGDSGKTSESAIKKHTTWITSTLLSVEILQAKRKEMIKSSNNINWKKVIYFNASFDCMWRPTKYPGYMVNRNELLGNIFTKENKEHQVISSSSGTILWQKHHCFVSKSDTVVAIAVK